MKPSEDTNVLTTLKATGEIYNKQVSAAAVAMFLADLDQYTSDQVLKALSLCRRELKFFPSVAEVIARIDDGRPGVEEAWAMLPKTEYDSVVWTAEMAESFGAIRGIIEEDPIAARMAFKELYSKAVAIARADRTQVEWTASLGHDKRSHAEALNAAIAKGRIGIEYASQICVEIQDQTEQGMIKYLDVKSLLKDMPKP
jgi:hypothetical protein